MLVQALSVIEVKEIMSLTSVYGGFKCSINNIITCKSFQAASFFPNQIQGERGKEAEIEAINRKLGGKQTTIVMVRQSENFLRDILGNVTSFGANKNVNPTLLATGGGGGGGGGS